MKYIRKAGCPHVYSQWCSAVAGTSKADWREVPSATKGHLLAGLIAEQGELCAYTMRRISKESSHVEHIKPQGLCRANLYGSDLDYSNLVACFPREGMKGAYRYGAQFKDSWWDDDGSEFVSPLQSSCERFFRFGLDGEIAAVGKRGAAITTIRVLGLNHQSLAEDRKRAIEEFIYGPSGHDPMSPANARRTQRNICDRDGHGRFAEFCVALRDAVEAHLTALAKIGRRRIAMRRSRSRVE
jgi:uncharacterized protein (TIGR02646 family)